MVNMKTNFGHFFNGHAYSFRVCCKDDDWGRKAVLSIQRKNFTGATGRKMVRPPKRLDTSQEETNGGWSRQARQ